jgi:translation initiation factor 1
MERKGRSGKEVTVVEQLGLPARELEAWLKDLKGALGCGGALEGATLVLQGDQRKRLLALLTARGVRKVTVG